MKALVKKLPGKAMLSQKIPSI